MSAPNPRLVERQMLRQIDTVAALMVEREVLAGFAAGEGNAALAAQLAAMANSAEQRLALMQGNYLAFLAGLDRGPHC